MTKTYCKYNTDYTDASQPLGSKHLNRMVHGQQDDSGHQAHGNRLLSIHDQTGPESHENHSGKSVDPVLTTLVKTGALRCGE